MASISITRNHQLGLEGARRVSQKVVDKLAEKFGLSSDGWQGNSLAFSRPGVDGKVRISDSLVEVSIELGFMFAGFAGAIEQQLAASIDKAIAAG